MAMFENVTDGHEDISFSHDQDDDHDEGFATWQRNFYRLMIAQTTDLLTLLRREAAIAEKGWQTGDDVLNDLPGLLSGTPGRPKQTAS